MRRDADTVERSGRHCDDDFSCVCILGGTLKRYRTKRRIRHDIPTYDCPAGTGGRVIDIGFLFKRTGLDWTIMFDG